MMIPQPNTLVPLFATVLFSAFSAGCLALPERLEGTNYPADAPPYISTAASAAALTTASGSRDGTANDALPQQQNLIHRLVLIGDAGVPMDSEPVLASLTRWADAHADLTSVIFLGDNVYPAGIADGKTAKGEEVMRKQIASTSATRIFIPGNHDWGHVGKDRLLRQQAYVDANGAEFMPRDGCPGPVLRPIVPPTQGRTRGISAIFFDIDPWYFAKDEVRNCVGSKTPGALGVELGELLQTHKDQWLIVGAHHPLRTGGPHGGFTRGALGDFLTGAIYMIFGTLQDTYEDDYREIMRPIEAALASAPPMLYAAGHDHNLQVLEGGKYADYQIVSGAGATNRVRHGDVTDIEGTLFAHGHAGFMIVDFVQTDSGERAELHVIETGQDAPVFSMELGRH